MSTRDVLVAFGAAASSVLVSCGDDDASSPTTVMTTMPLTTSAPATTTRVGAVGSWADEAWNRGVGELVVTSTKRRTTDHEREFRVHSLDRRVPAEPQ
jgi:hypothetical protein